MEKIIEIEGKQYTEAEIWAIRRYVEKMKCREEASEIVDHIMEDESGSDIAFARWLEKNRESMTEHIEDMIEQRNMFDYLEVIDYDPYAETLRQYYEVAMSE